jgi:hypothetical protein
MTLPFKYFDEYNDEHVCIFTKYLSNNFPYQYIHTDFPPQHWIKWLVETLGEPMIFFTSNTSNYEILNYDAKWEWLSNVIYFKDKNDLMLFTLWRH